MPDLDEDGAVLEWGDRKPAEGEVATRDGAHLAVWEVGDSDAPVVVLLHGWTNTHAVWIPVARRLLEAGHRIVLYDLRGHGASSLGTEPLSIDLLANDLASVLEAYGITDAVLTGHSMGGIAIMSLATHRPDVLDARARALVLVSTAAANQRRGSARAERFAARVIASSLLTRAMRTRHGYRLVRTAFGVDPVRADMELTRDLVADTDGPLRVGLQSAVSSMDLREGIAAIDVPTTVVVGSRDRLAVPARSHEIVATIPGARLVTLEDRGHMVPLEDPDAVADEIIRAVNR